MKDQPMAAAVAKDSKRRRAIVWEYAKSILMALVLALLIRTFVVQAYEIPSGSMENTLLIGDHILVNKFLFGTKIPFTNTKILAFRHPLRGDVIVFAYPKDPDKDFIKRVIGLPGDRIQIINKKVYVNGQVYENPHAVYKDNNELIPAAESPRDNTGVITVPANSYFVMGDNRDNSYDSRFWGFVKSSAVKGLAFVKYWSWDSRVRRVRWGSIGQLID